MKNKRRVDDDLKLYGVSYVYEGQVLNPGKMIVYRTSSTDLNKKVVAVRDPKMTEADFGIA